MRAKVILVKACSTMPLRAHVAWKVYTILECLEICSCFLGVLAAVSGKLRVGLARLDAERRSWLSRPWRRRRRHDS